MPLVEAEVKGQRGWYDDKTQEFLPSTDWVLGEHQGKQGLFNAKSSEFQPLDIAPAPVAPKAEGETTGQFLQGLLRKITPYARPALEYGGMLGGSAITGGPVTPTGIAGGALGYAGGKSVANVLEQLAGQKQPKDLLTEAANAGKDVVQGTEDMMAGPVIGKALGGLGRGANWVLSKITGEPDAARWLMSKALRTPLDASWKRVLPGEDFTKRAAVVDESLAKEIYPDERGLKQVVSKIAETDKAVGEEVVRLTKQGGLNTPTSVLRDELKALRKDAWYSKNGPKNIAEIDALDADIVRMGGTKSALTPQELHTVKQQLYRDANYERAKPLLNNNGRFNEEATKKIAHTAMTKLEEMAPDVIGPLNKTEGLYLDIKKAVEETISRYDRADIAGFGAKVLAVKNLGLAALEMITGTPSMKARIAFAIKAAQKSNPDAGRGLMMYLNNWDSQRREINRPDGGTIDRDALMKELERRGAK